MLGGTVSGQTESNLIERQPKLFVRPGNRVDAVRMRRPFWLPASSYYVLAAAVSLAFFFLVWGILHDGGDETPWITAGVGASIVLIGAVILREIILRRARNRYVLFERSFDRQLNDVLSRLGNERNSDKLTVERNADLLREIKKKSDAAKVLGRLAVVHREVFELCDEYLVRNERELRFIGTGSPRLGPLRKGKDSVGRYHRFHLLRWAEIESTSLTLDAKNRAEVSEKVEAAQSAINVIETALDFYPNEHSLLESREVLQELLASIKVSHWVEKAEIASFRGDYKQARSLYRDALFYLGRDNIISDARDMAAAKINAEIDKLRQLDDGHV